MPMSQPHGNNWIRPIEQQIERLRGHVQKQPGWHLEEKHIYLDEGYSGAKLNRPGLDRLREHISKAEFEMIISGK